MDSSLVVALMAKLCGEPVQTFSIGFREEAFNELPFAQRAAEICRTTHHPEIVDGDVEHGSLMAGQSVGIVQKVQPLREILQDMVAEADQGLAEVQERLGC